MNFFTTTSTPDHDYDPAWDYEVVNPGTDANEMLARVEALVRKEILPVLRIQGMKVFFVEDCEGALARYCSGTASFPFIVVDYAALVSGCDEHGLDIESQLAATLAHELAHAHQESLGIEDIGDHEEDGAEKFSRLWVMSGVIDPTHIGAEPEERG